MATVAYFMDFPYGQTIKLLVGASRPKPCDFGPTWPEVGAPHLLLRHRRYRSCSLFFCASVSPNKRSMLALAVTTSCMSFRTARYCLYVARFSAVSF